MLVLVDICMSLVGVTGFAGGEAIANLTCSENSEKPTTLNDLNLNV